MKRMMLKLWAIVCIVCSCAYAGVKWDSQVIDVQAKPGDEWIEFAFPFKNGGALPVHLEAPVASCDCTLVELKTFTFSKGESGEIRGIYDLAGRRGQYAVTITVKGAEVDGQTRRPFTDTLRLNVTVPEVVKVSPGVTLWRKNSVAEAKTIRFEVNEPFLMPLKLAKVSRETFAGEWKEVEKGKAYELLVTPASTGEVGSAMVTIEGVTENGKTLRFYAHLIIR